MDGKLEVEEGNWTNELMDGQTKWKKILINSPYLWVKANKKRLSASYRLLPNKYYKHGLSSNFDKAVFMEFHKSSSSKQNNLNAKV